MSRANFRPSLDVLIQCPGSHGVIPDHVHEQATAMHDLGLNVLVLCCPAYTRSRAAAYPTIPCMLEGATTSNTNAFSRKFAKALQTVRNQLRFAWEVYNHRPTLVLSASHVDSQSPLWIWPHFLICTFRKTIYAMNLHFAHRDHHLGPKWWQKLCTNLSFNPFKIAIAHKRLPSANIIPKFIRCVEVPIGPEKTLQIRENPKQIRKRWNVPRGKKVFLSFGHVRNHKNLDLVIRALLENHQAFLVILGRVSNHRDRPLKYYQMLADDLGLSKRVLISDEFVPDEKRQSYFEAADFIISTYSSGFRSQTATLATAANARRYVLSSSGNSPMRDLVEHFGLGVFVEPDSSEAVADGMATLLNGELPEANWEGFEAHATWETNVMRFLEASADIVAGRPTPERQFEGLEDEAVRLPTIISARSLLPAKSVKISPIKKAAPQKPQPVARNKSAKPKPPNTSGKLAAPHLVEKFTDPIVSNDTQPIFPGFEAPPLKINGANGHTHLLKKTEPAVPKSLPARKPRSRISKVEPTAERPRAEIVTV
jgi:glycosyltransferase involved in cell wall biosynthesis